MASFTAHLDFAAEEKSGGDGEEAGGGARAQCQRGQRDEARTGMVHEGSAERQARIGRGRGRVADRKPDSRVKPVQKGPGALGRFVRRSQEVQGIGLSL